MEQSELFTEKTRKWLDAMFTSDEKGRGLFNPVFGFGASGQQMGHAEKIARAIRIMQLVSLQAPRDILDVGAAEGYLASCIKQFLNVPTAACDLSIEACKVGRELLGIPTFSCSIDHLPVCDEAFDCVICSEVIEHLAEPMAAISELIRITGRILIITSRETFHYQIERYLRLKLRNLDKPHAELNLWLPRDFASLLGNDIEFHRQFRSPIQISDDEQNSDAIIQKLMNALAIPQLDREGLGGIIIWRRQKERNLNMKNNLPPLEDIIRTLLNPRPQNVVAEDEDLWLQRRLCAFASRNVLVKTNLHELASELGEKFPIIENVPFLIHGEASKNENRYINPRIARKYEKMFDPKNIWRQPTLRLLALTILGCAEFIRDLKRRLPLGVAWNQFCHSTRFLRRRFSRNHQGWLVYGKGQNSVYRIDKGKRRLIPSPEILDRMGYNFDEVVEVSTDWLQKYPPGEPYNKID